MCTLKEIKRGEGVKARVSGDERHHELCTVTHVASYSYRVVMLIVIHLSVFSMKGGTVSFTENLGRTERK